MEKQHALSRGEIARGLRAFITASAIWGAWGQTVGIGTAVFTGYALWLGADESFIALLSSMAQLLALTQLVAAPLGRCIKDKKRFIVAAGFGEILFRGSPLLIPFLLAPALHLGALMLLVGASLLCGYLISPFYNTWLANTVPEEIRARFVSRQTIFSTLVAMASGYLIGQFLDFFAAPEKQRAFTWVFAAGTLCGLLGYLTLSRAPFPRPEESGAGQGSFHLLLQPFRERNFRRTALFYGLWVFALGLAGPLYSVFMLEYLEISYTRISIFNALFMLVSIVGYRVWGGLVDRFGSKPVLHILLVPAALIPLLWIFNRPDFYPLVPVALVLSGALFSGIGVSITPLLYSLLPRGEERTFYLASWAASVSLLGALGPLAGSFLARYLQSVHLELAGFGLGSLQIIFAISAAARLVPIVLLHFVRDAKGISSRHLLAQMLRGNVLSYAYNAAIYNFTTAEKRRARAALGLGRSGNPLAIEQLIQALADASPRVRRSAARALGETGSELATDSLIRELLDGESEVRREAAEALGRLGHSGSIEALIEALEDQDLGVRISAIRGLGEIGDEEVQELLFWHFSDQFDRRTFPTLVDELSARGDHRIVKPALEHLLDFHSPAIRLQLLNGVCRVLGAKDQFYRLLSAEATGRTGEIGRLLKRASSRLLGSRALDPEVRHELNRSFQRLIQAHENDNIEWMAESTGEIAGLVRDGLSAAGRPAYEVLSVYLAILAINTFLRSSARRELAAAQESFLAVCLVRLAGLVHKLDD